MEPTFKTSGSPAFKQFVQVYVLDLLKLIIPIVASLALLAFFWGLVKFISNLQGNPKAVAEGKNLMIYGILALFVMVSVWGILRFLSGELGLGTILVPFLPTN